MTREDTRRGREEYAKRPDENFVGRKNELKEFRRRLKSCREKPVWHLHGVGGVGKSELLKFFREECGDKSRPCAYVDLSSDTSKSEAGLLKEIADELGFPEFPAFRRVHERFDRLQKAQPTLTDRLEATMETAKLASSVTPAGGAVDYAKEKVGGWLKRKDAEFLGDSSTQLFDTFVGDLRDYTHDDQRGLPVVLLFDTYEQASGVQEGIVQDLVLACRAACPDVLFVLTGRDRLGWEHPDQNPIWREEKLIAQQRLEEFADKDARAYLKKRKVTDPDLAERILKLTRRFPMFLRLACDIVDQVRDRGETPTADEFPEKQLDHDKVAEFLVRRIIERLPEDRKHLEPAIKLLGIPRWFDLPVFALLLGRKAIEVGPEWRQLLEMSSLFRPTGTPDRHTYHDCVRDAVLSWWKGPEEEKIAHHRSLAEWHVTRSKGGAEFDHLREALYHQTAYEPLAAVREWSELCDKSLADRRIAHYEALLHDVGDYPIAYAELPAGEAGEMHFLIGYAFNSCPTRWTSIVTQAIRHYEAALEFYTEKGFPQQWAMTQNNLGNAYAELPTGDRGQNLEKAIGCFEAAVRVFNEKGFPQQWAMTRNNLGTAYAELPTGDRGQNLEKAIGCFEAAVKVYTEEEFPQDWAGTQNNLGIAYRNLPTGDRGENLEKATRCYEAALRVYTEEEFPQQWAMTQNNLGTAYAQLPTGDRGVNLGEAIKRFRAALRVRTEEEFPQDWAGTQNNLGNAYSELPTGDRGVNLGEAIKCFRAALRVRTEKEFPQGWGTTMYNLGLAHLELARHSRAPEELKEARCCLLDAARGYRAVGDAAKAEDAESMAAEVAELLEGLGA